MRKYKGPLCVAACLATMLFGYRLGYVRGQRAGQVKSLAVIEQALAAIERSAGSGTDPVHQQAMTDLACCREALAD